MTEGSARHWSCGIAGAERRKLRACNLAQLQLELCEFGETSVAVRDRRIGKVLQPLSGAQGLIGLSVRDTSEYLALSLDIEFSPFYVFPVIMPALDSAP